MIFKYKCRMCGKIFGGLDVLDKFALKYFWLLRTEDYVGREVTGGLTITKIDVHFCDGNERPLKRLGIGDLIGAQAE